MLKAISIFYRFNVFNLSLCNCKECFGALAWYKNNLAFPVFLAGYAASRGGMLVRAQPSWAFIDGTTSFGSIWPVVDFYLLPEVYIKLIDEGYPEEFMRARILTNLNFVRFVLKFPIYFLKSIKLYIKAFRLKRAL